MTGKKGGHVDGHDVTEFAHPLKGPDRGD